MYIMNKYNYHKLLLHMTPPPSLHLHEVVGWTVEVAGCLRGQLRQAASAGSIGAAQMCESLGHPLR
jgi:hypothetical protein